MRRLATLVLILTAACAEAPQTYRDLDRLGRDYQREVSNLPQTAEEATRRDACGASGFAHLLGTPASAIDRASLPAQTRIISPGMMVTQDFSPQRLNIHVAPDGKVAALDCF
ncbi:MAG: I78 family peptidase inhibitor [Terricaulis sp.]